MRLKNNILIVLVISFLTTLIGVQFLWVYRVGTNQQRQFEFTVVAALNKAVVELNKQDSVCLQVTHCFNAKKLTRCQKRDLSYEKWNFIDSLIRAELSYSKISIHYEFELGTFPHPHENAVNGKVKHKCFTVKSDMRTTKGEPIWLHITFPLRNKFILAQIGWLFIGSIVLILLTIFAFILIYKMYRQEQIMASDTRNFINNLTHEFKTPITSIRLANNQIIKRISDNRLLEPFTRIIDEENKKLEGHVNYLLDVSRLQKGKVPLNYTEVDMHELLFKQIQSFQLLIEERNGKIALMLDADKTKVLADAFHLGNAINNILDNACKYSPDHLEITIKTKNDRGMLIMEFSDKGLGIEKADRKTIFQEFSRVDTGNIHNVKGFGLGLSYVGQVVKMHKGHIKLLSEKGLGSTFIIYIPIYKNGRDQA